MKKLFKKHNPPKNGQFQKAREHNNQILISIVTSQGFLQRCLISGREQIIVDKHQRKCKNSCEKFQALKLIGSQHN